MLRWSPPASRGADKVAGGITTQGPTELLPPKIFVCAGAIDLPQSKLGEDRETSPLDSSPITTRHKPPHTFLLRSALPYQPT